MSFCVWKDVRCEQRESKGRSGLNGESGSETVCGGMEGRLMGMKIKLVESYGCLCLHNYGLDSERKETDVQFFFFFFFNFFLTIFHHLPLGHPIKCTFVLAERNMASQSHISGVTQSKLIQCLAL